MKEFFNSSDYLKRIGYAGSRPSATLETLEQLHQLHLFNVPFENLDIHLGREIRLDVDRSFRKIAPTRRGGFCYELNNLFHHLLADLGFEVYFISSMVYRPDTDTFAPDFGHISNIVTIDGKEWLADVGFGDGYIRPLRFEFDLPQEQRGVTYKLQEREDGVCLLRSTDGKAFIPMYRFFHTPRKIEEFQAMCIFHQTSPHSPFLQKKICTLPDEEGRITLTHDALITTRNRIKESRPVESEEEFWTLLEEIFGIRIGS